MQGYDSVAMGVDMEIGGNDQTFNMLVGRTMLKNRGKEKFVLTTKLLVDPTGKKMGKSEGNMVTLQDSNIDMFGKVMSWSDSLMPLAFEICTRVPVSTIKEIQAMNPRDAKLRLAYEIVKLYEGEKKAKEAQENFIKTFSKKETPENIEEVKAKEGSLLSEVLVEHKILSSKSEWRRLVLENAIHDLDNDKNIGDPNIKITNKLTLKIGKKKFIKILV
jgi:tyrosyl-tRNA synthetase